MYAIIIVGYNAIINAIIKYDNQKSKYGEKARLCYMDKDIFIVYVKTDGLHKDTAEYVEKMF